ncbi:Hypothetical_protein [Hexamita inflata]|uniref:Hypothetical_protein n=1 Tax=Hexamita inflata TaxID=28002 RepID=A0AA86PTW7_9EUKA|nr:Hypothetical protein HINF_LOCUS32533 [Hexamita inflata]
MKMWPRVRTLDILCVLGPVWRYDLALQLKQQQIQWAPRIIQQQFVKLFSVRKTFGLLVSLEGDTKINSLLLVDISAFKVGRFTQLGSYKLHPLVLAHCNDNRHNDNYQRIFNLISSTLTNAIDSTDIIPRNGCSFENNYRVFCETQNEAQTPLYTGDLFIITSYQDEEAGFGEVQVTQLYLVLYTSY